MNQSILREAELGGLILMGYKRNELLLRISDFYSGYTLSSAFGDPIGAGIIGIMDGVGLIDPGGKERPSSSPSPIPALIFILSSSS